VGWKWSICDERCIRFTGTGVTSAGVRWIIIAYCEYVKNVLGNQVKVPVSVLVADLSRLNARLEVIVCCIRGWQWELSEDHADYEAENGERVGELHPVVLFLSTWELYEMRL
jgi:hypothetical protein